MGLTGALITSRSGLVAVGKWSEATAGNIANAGTEGYVRKTADLTTRASSFGAQVEVAAITREVDASLDRMHRLEISRMAKEQAVADGLEFYSARLGQPGDELSPSGKLTNFFAALDMLVNNPSDTALQRNALVTAGELASSLNTATQALAQAGTEAGTAIERDVATLNTILHDLDGLNQRLSSTDGATMTRATLEDEIGKKIDGLSELMDVKVTRLADGRINIVSAGGTPLLDTTTVHEVTYDRFAGRLTADGVDLTPGVSGARAFENGSLAGRIALQNQILPKMQLQLDEFARVLVEGFQAADATLAPGQAGLFTDAGAPFDPAQLDGLAGRISINDAVRPEAGGALWRLRDGIGAAAPGPVAASGQLVSFLEMLDAPQTFAGAAGLGSTMALTRYAADMTADQQFTRAQALERRDALGISAEAIGSLRQGVQGVNVDDELQQLMMIEQSFAANSKVMSTVASMIDTLLAAI